MYTPTLQYTHSAVAARCRHTIPITQSCDKNACGMARPRFQTAVHPHAVKVARRCLRDYTIRTLADGGTISCFCFGGTCFETFVCRHVGFLTACEAACLTQ